MVLRQSAEGFRLLNASSVLVAQHGERYMASWSRCNRYGTAPLQTIYINLDHVITAERVREYTLVKLSDESETVVEPPELVVCAIQSGDERCREKNIPIPTQHGG